MPYTTEARIATPDGAVFELRRVPAPERAKGLPPVLMVHGLGVNHRNMDLYAGASIARHLSERRRDVWLLTLRCAARDAGALAGPAARFAPMVEHDLPMAVEEVRLRTGCDVVDYLGFSMGGMLLYAGIGRTVPAARIRRAVFIGSPGRLTPLMAPVRWARWMHLPLPGRLPNVPVARSVCAVASVADQVVTPVHRWLYNPDNCGSGTVGCAIVNALVDVPPDLALEFARWALGDGEVRFEGHPIVEGLTELTVPALFIAGAADRLAPPAAVAHAYRFWGRDSGASKELVVVGRASGAAADYGHGDLAIAADVGRDVYQPVAEFLDWGRPWARPSQPAAGGLIMARSCSDRAVPPSSSS